jgi:long-chain acyl-CoA synthetase
MNFDSIKLVHQFLENSADKYPDKTAIVHEGIRATYKQINSYSNQLAKWLIFQGIGKGDMVPVLIENSIEYVVSYYGIMKTGAVAVPLNSEIKPDGLKPLLKELQPKAIISSYRSENTFQSINLQEFNVQNLLFKESKLNWTDKSVKTHHWKDIIKDENFPNIDTFLGSDNLASIIYTSGSTGTPKGVMLTHNNILVNTKSIVQYLKLTEKDIQLVVLPFFYVMGKSLLNTHFAVGGTVVINNKFAFPAAVIKQMVDEKVTGFSGVPSTYAYLLHRSPLEKNRDKLTNLRYCSQAGGHMSKQIKQDLRRVLPKYTEIFIMYGATEASARLTYLEPSRFDDKIESIGKAIPDVTVRILDDNGNEVASGQVGEIVGSGANIMQGYYKDSELTAKVLDHNGYHTGDLGYQDEEGFLYLVGRRDNLLKVGGHRINPQEIEDAIMETGVVVEVAVIGVPDELLGNKLIAIVAPINEQTDSNKILELCAAKFSKNRLPSKVIIVKSLPKHPSGKIDKKKCREIII